MKEADDARVEPMGTGTHSPTAMAKQAGSEPTPGPWTIGVALPHTILVFAGNAKVADVTRRKNPERFLANARLIAAAPDMLAALKPFAGMVHHDGVDAPYPEEKWIPLLDAAARAIAKAEGR